MITGQKFAMLEIKIAVTALVKNFVFLPVENYEPEVISQVSMKSANGICVKIKKREK